MCILFIALKQHAKYPVIICANRDEFHDRPTQSMHVWPHKNIVAGKDLQAGGTWLGLTKSQQFSALTNFRQPDLIDATKTSRGDLVIKALSQSNIDANHQKIKSHLESKSDIYNGFNLIYGSLEKLQCFDSVNKSTRIMENGVFSICNGALEDSWPKMTLGEQQLSQLISDKPESIDHHSLLEIMTNTSQATDEQLPKTGLPLDKEKLLSSIFITSPTYGTRSTIIITKDVTGEVNVTEATYHPSGQTETLSTRNLSEIF
jgi:uncharacterized protein with NRDE domain